MPTIQFTDFLQSGTVVVSATAGTAVLFPTAFTSPPRVFVTPYSAGGTFATSAEAITTGSFTLRTEAAGSICWFALFSGSL